MPGSTQNAILENNEQLKQMREKLKRDGVDIFVMEPPELMVLWQKAQVNNGLTAAKAKRACKDKLEKENLSEYLKYLDKGAALTVGYTASALDAKLLHSLGKDLQKGGNFLSRYRLDARGGKTYIIFKGNQRTRELIRGTRYLANNMKLVEMGIGKAGAAKAIVSGMRLTVYLSVGYRFAELLFKDESTWEYFIGSLATDLVKIGVAGAASYIAASFVSTTFVAAGAIVVGPLFAAIAVGVLVSWALNSLDEQTGFTKALIQSIEDAAKNYQDSLNSVKREYYMLTDTPLKEAQFWMRVFGAY